MKRKLILTAPLVCFSLLCSITFPQVKPDSCTIKSLANDRKAVKNRTPAKGAGYRQINNGSAITVPEFYDLVCGFSDQLPDKKDISQTKPIDEFETVTVTVRGFLLAAKFEGGEDKDIHAQIAVDADPNSDQLIIEVPAGKSFCDARRALWGFVKEDREKAGKKTAVSSWRLIEPPEITVTGFLFLDAHHIKRSLTKDEWCVDNGGRGLQFPTGSGKKTQSFVKGLWEIHPVISIS
ncbi:MAG TPA: hypothetical protein VKN18_22875 [Blastocatellia bacterium]|nr:hypothetical protein [Blastocatellia bacterium]